MIVKSKEYSSEQLGGYLLNYVVFKEDLIIEKKAYKMTSVVEKYNKIYNMVNYISATPFKIILYC